MNHKELSNIGIIEVRKLHGVTVTLKRQEKPVMREVFVDKEHAPDIKYAQVGTALLISQEQEETNTQQLFLFIGEGIIIKADETSKPLLENQGFEIEDL